MTQSHDDNEEEDDEDVEAFYQDADKEFVGESIGLPTTVDDVAAGKEPSSAVQSYPYDAYSSSRWFLCNNAPPGNRHTVSTTLYLG